MPPGAVAPQGGRLRDASQRSIRSGPAEGVGAMNGGGLSAAGTRRAGDGALDRWTAALALAAAVDRQPGRIFPDVIGKLAARHGDRPALLSRHETLSFAGLAERSNLYARWGLARGIRPGDRVALLMPNRPDYLAAWIGLTRVGGVVALLNTNLTGTGLAHCVRAAAPAHAIVAASLETAWRSAEPHLGADAPALWLRGEEAGTRDFAGLSDAPLDVGERPALTTADPALLIYTSGTTGLPKAARVSHHRVMMWSHWFAGLMGVGPDDRMYDCLPLYHSVGGLVAPGAALVGGGSVVVAERFSAGGFWDEVAATDCTLVQYIGELCRYLLKTAPSMADRGHRVRLACGNGLGADVWEPFKERFGLPRILEFYAATEGNFSLYNVEGKPGAIGRVPGFLAGRFAPAIVRHDPDTGLPARGPDGFCLRCPTGEAGEAIGRIAAADGTRSGRFEGYTAAADSERKVLRDVFAPGDSWFRTGDLMRLDTQGYFHFVDRVGDTFRWKGENVSTTEVAEVVATCPGVAEACVYGVSVPGADGRAGMAALVPGETFDPGVLHRHLAERLPAYARPVVLRLCDGFAVTETFKRKKAALAAEGFDPGRIADPLLLAGPDGYVPLDAALYERVVQGELRL